MEPSIPRVSERMRVRPARERTRRPRADDEHAFRVDPEETPASHETAPPRRRGERPIGHKPGDESGSRVDVVA